MTWHRCSLVGPQFMFNLASAPLRPLSSLALHFDIDRYMHKYAQYIYMCDAVVTLGPPVRITIKLPCNALGVCVRV